jgi:hypothetical protein
MSTMLKSESTSAADLRTGTIAQPLPQPSWEALCAWLTENLRGMEVTIERREGNGEWVVECLSYPLESVTTHQTLNGVQVISICVRMNGIIKSFEIAGPHLINLHRNAAGWPVKVEMGYQEGQLTLLFSGQMEPQRKITANSWGE